MDRHMRFGQPSLFDEERLSWDAALELTAQSLNAYARRYKHWAIAYSGGKDSTATVSVIVHLLNTGAIPSPQTLTVLYADTRMELPPLYHAAMRMLEHLRRQGIKTQIVLPNMEDRFFVYMLGRGVPPPSNTFRWCTGKLKIEPMIASLRRLRESTGEKLLMLTGVRLGESAARDSRIALSCGKNGSECGQGWFQESTPSSVADTLAPLLHWRICFVWDWLYFMAQDLTGLPTRLVAETYGAGSGDKADAIEANLRTGCVGCNLAARDVALESVIKQAAWSHLSPLMELRPLYAELKKPSNRLRKDGTETRKDGSLVANPCRMGPLTFEARLWALDRVKDIQRRARVDLINIEEETMIRALIAAKTWPRGWSGSEPVASAPFVNVNPDGSMQPVMEALLA